MVTNELECNFLVENLKAALFCNTFIYKLKVTCCPRLKLYWYWDFIMCVTCSRKKERIYWKYRPCNSLLNFSLLHSLCIFYLGLDFLEKILPFTENLIFQLSTSIMTALSNPFMYGWYRQFYMRTTQWHFKSTFKL